MRTAKTARSIFARAREAKLTFLAASIAYYAFFSIVPLLLLALSLGTLLGGQALADQLVSLVGEHLSSQGQTVVEEALTSPAGRRGASVVGVAGLFWSAFKIFRALDVAFGQVYRVGEDTSLIHQLFDGVIVLIAIGFAVIVMVGLGTVIRISEVIDIPGINLYGWVGLVIGLTVIFLPIFYVTPPVSVQVREILPETASTVAGWLLLQAGFQMYATNVAEYQAYGLLGTVLLFLTWLYFAAVLVLLGATVNAVLAGQ